MSLRSRLGFTAEPVYLMDGSAFIFRSFFAFRSMNRSDGFPTNVVYMVARLILRLLRDERPHRFAFVMDGKGKTFRHERFDAYKSQRPPTPEDLVRQLAPLKELLELLAVPVLVSEGCEADDCIASLAARLRDDYPVVIIGADKDLKQCLHDNVVLWDPAAKDEKITTLADFTAESGMAPSSWPDYQALVGDSSDNIPGVPQIGPKSAGELIRDFPTLEELFARINAVPPKLRAKLDGQKDNAFLYRELTRLQLDACPEQNDASLLVGHPNLPRLQDFMAAYELRSLARKVESMARAGFFCPAGAPQHAAACTAPDATAQTTPQTKPDAAKSAIASAVNAPANAAPPAPQAGGLLASSASGPQPVEPFTPPKATRQAGLFETPAPAPAFSAAARPEDLPPLAQKNAASAPGPSHHTLPGAFSRPPMALLPMQEGPVLAATGWERQYTGRPESLDAALTKPPLADYVLVTPDYKALCKSHPGLRALPDAHFFDLSLAAYLLGPEDRGYSFEHMAARWKDPSGSKYSLADHPGLLALDLARYLGEQMEGAALTAIFSELEMPLAPVLADMEERGIRIDAKAFADFLEEVQRDIESLTQRIHALAGHSFNIRSSQQLADVLFVELALPVSGKTKGGAPSTSDESLEKLSGKHDIITLVQQFRKLEKLRSTYLEPLPRLADAKGRIHTTLNQTATATGRLSSSSPNLQNIPVRGDFGSRMRGCFVAEPEKLLVCADYSQIELRVLAHLSGDPTLLEAFRENQDIHSRTAALLFDVALDEVTKDMRRNAKTINFGLIYGMGAQKLAQEMHVSMKEAKEFIERYFERLGGLKTFYETVEREASENGFVATMAGRRRLTPDILSQNNQLRSQARRQAINTRIQGSAADIIKLAMLAVANDAELKRLDARLLLQIHDELLLEAPKDTAKAAGKRLADLMALVKPGGQALSVPLLVDWGIGSSWALAH